jgi:hypothetical protein
VDKSLFPASLFTPSGNNAGENKNLFPTGLFTQPENKMIQSAHWFMQKKRRLKGSQ